MISPDDRHLLFFSPDVSDSFGTVNSCYSPGGKIRYFKAQTLKRIIRYVADIRYANIVSDLISDSDIIAIVRHSTN